MKNFKTLGILSLAIVCSLSFAAQAAGIDVASFLNPDVIAGLSMAGAAGITTYQQEGEVLTLTPDATVTSGGGHLFGAALFGVAINTTAASTPGEFVTEGVVVISKTAPLAIAVGDRLFWDPITKVVNKTTTNQQCVGVAVEAASGGTASVPMKLVASTATAA